MCKWHHRLTAPLAYRTTGLRQHWLTTALAYGTTGLPHHIWLTAPLAYGTTGLPHHWLTASLAYGTTGLPHHWLTAPLAYRTTRLRHHWLTAPLAYRSTGTEKGLCPVRQASQRTSSEPLARRSHSSVGRDSAIPNHFSKFRFPKTRSELMFRAGIR